MARSPQARSMAWLLCRGVVGFALNPTNKGPKGIADMGCELLASVLPCIRPCTPHHIMAGSLQCASAAAFLTTPDYTAPVLSARPWSKTQSEGL